MQDQKRFFISLAAALGLVVASAGAYAVFHVQDEAFDEAEADADLLDDLDTFPTLKKGDRQTPAQASNPLAAPHPDEVASDTTVVMTQRRSAFRPMPAPTQAAIPTTTPGTTTETRPAVALETNAQPQLAYANPTVPPVSPEEPFRSLDRGIEPEPDALDDPVATPIDEVVAPTLPAGSYPIPRDKPRDVPKLASLDPSQWTPIELPVPRRKPAVPKVETVATAPGPMNLGQVPVEPVKPLAATPAPTVAVPTAATALALAPNPAPKAPGSLVSLPPRGQVVAPTGPTALPASPAEAARRERVVIPPGGGEEPPGLRANRPVLASLTPPGSSADQPPPVILRTPFGTPFVLQTSSVDMSCAPPKLVGLLRTIEKRYGKKVVVTSGNRTRGRRGSLHLRCMAADIIVPGVDADDLARFARSIPGIGGVGRYCHGNMIHVDIGRPREWKYGCGSYFVARDGTGGEWGKVPQEARGDD